MLFAALLPWLAQAPPPPQVEISGRLMFDASFFAGADDVSAALGTPVADGAEVRRARLDARARLAPDLRGWLALDFAGGAVRFREASVSLATSEAAEWKIGYFKVPFFLDASGSSNDFDLLEAPASEDALTVGRNAGLGWFSSAAAWNASAALYRRASDRLGASEDESGGFAARGVWRPWGAPESGRLLHLAADLGWEWVDETAAFTSRAENHLLPVLLDTGALAADGVLRFGGEFAWRVGAWHGAAEWMRASLDAEAAGDPDLDGWTLSVGHFLTGESRPYDVKKAAWGRVAPRAPWSSARRGGEGGGGADGGGASGGGAGAWEVVARWSALDFSPANAGELAVQNLGVVWYATEHLRAYLDLQRYELDELDPFYGLGLRVGVDF